MDGGAVYFTPNTFYSRRKKTKDALRWPNAIYVDIDDPAKTMPDVLDRCWETGLPRPSIISKTPNGLHIYWKIEPARATEKALRLYAALLRSVAAAADGDLAAAAPERYLRIPYCLVYFNPAVYTLQDFSTWRDENFEVATSASGETGALVTTGILDHPAVRKLLEGVEKGRRDNTAFTLALAFKAAGYTPEQALNELTSGNFRNRPPLPAAQLRANVRSAYKSKYHGLSAEWIRELSEMNFRHRVARKRKRPADPGRPGRPNKINRAKRKLLLKLKLNHRGLRIRNQLELAKMLSVSLRTARTVLADLAG